MSHPFSVPELRAGNLGVVLGFCLPQSALRLPSTESFWRPTKPSSWTSAVAPLSRRAARGRHSGRVWRRRPRLRARGLVRAEITLWASPPRPRAGCAQLFPAFSMKGICSGHSSACSLPAACGPISAFHLSSVPLSPRAALLPWVSGVPLLGRGSLENAPEAPPRPR